MPEARAPWRDMTRGRAHLTVLQSFACRYRSVLTPWFAHQSLVLLLAFPLSFQVFVCASTGQTPPSSATAASTAPFAPPESRLAQETEAPEGSGVSTALHLRKEKGLYRVTAAEFEQVLAGLSGKKDVDAAQKISSLELTERLDRYKLGALAHELPGPESQQALLGKVDASAFLPPPPSEIPSAAFPTPDELGHWLRMATAYAGTTLARLPNFFATRETTFFADSPPRQERGNFIPYKPLHAVARSSVTVLYRDGRQVVDAPQSKRLAVAAGGGVLTSGEFGPILGTVLTDAAQGHLAWSHWEKGPSGPVAVFRYEVPRRRSHYKVTFCCTGKGESAQTYEQLSEYQGEIAINPADGTIVRLTLRANPKPAYPMVRADMLVEYGPVEIGGKTYTCPLRSVTVAIAHVHMPTSGREGMGFGGEDSTQAENDNDTPLQLLLNDVVFDNYHVFRSDSRVLPFNQGQPEP